MDNLSEQPIRKRVEALATPQLLVWARKSAGFDLESAAKKAQVKAEDLQSWEKGKSRPSIAQLRRLTQVYKRPLAVFYLSEPPTEFQALKDFRHLPGVIAGVESPQLRFEIRRAQNRRDLALELYELIEGAPHQFVFTASSSDDPEEVAEELRSVLGITYEYQATWGTGYDALNRWRAALEEAGILVFQATEVEVSEVRGFSIHDQPLPAVVVNIKDSVSGRIFTMLHELTHIALRRGGICDLAEDGQRRSDEQEVEFFCNMAAGAALVPRKDLLKENLVVRKRGPTIWTDNEIISLANVYGASREVILRRLLICQRTTEEFYRRKRQELQKEYELAKPPGKEGFAPPYRMVLSSAGHVFARLVLENYRQGNITASDVADFLEVRLKHLPKIEAGAFGAALHA